MLKFVDKITMITIKVGVLLLHIVTYNRSVLKTIMVKSVDVYSNQHTFVTLVVSKPHYITQEELQSISKPLYFPSDRYYSNECLFLLYFQGVQSPLTSLWILLIFLVQSVWYTTTVDIKCWNDYCDVTLQFVMQSV